MICFNDAKLHLVGLKTRIGAGGGDWERSVPCGVLGPASHLDALREESVAITRRGRRRRWRVRWLDEDVDDFLNACGWTLCQPCFGQYEFR